MEQINHRRQIGLPTISLVGYTNAGKTTLFNRLTGLNDLVANVLFATLDSTVNNFYLRGIDEEVYLSDTIGFIKNLPPLLIDAFKSTLLEAISADLVVHVIDGSDPRMEEKIKTVEEIFKELEIKKENVMYVFNKIENNPNLDRAIITNGFKEFTPVFISAKTGDGITNLMNIFATRLKGKFSSHK